MRAVCAQSQRHSHRVSSGLASSGVRPPCKPCLCNRRRGPLVLHHRRTSSFAPTRAIGDPTIGSAQLASMSVVLASTIITGMYWWLVVVPSERATLSKSKRRGTMRQYLQDIQNDPSRQAERWFYADWLRQLEKREGKKATGPQAAPSATATQQSTTQGSSATNTSTSSSVEQGQGSPAAPLASTAAREDSTVQQQGVAQPLAQAQQAQPLQQQQQQQPQLSQPPQQQPQQQPEASGVSKNLLEPTERTPEPRFLSLDNPVVLTATLLGGLVALSAAFH